MPHASRRALGAVAVLGLVASAACSIDFDRHFGNDSAPDCAAAASTTRCVAAAPPGFDGPVVVVEGAAPTCPEATEEVDGGGACTACRCEGSVACAPASVGFFQDACGGTPDTTITAPVDGSCVPVNVSGGLSRALARPGAATASCTATGGATTTLRLCAAAPGQGCGAGERCLPAGEGRACVHAAGDVACPAPFDLRFTLASGDATATCGACACEAPATCPGSVTLGAGSGCGGATTNVPADGSSCVSYADVSSQRFVAGSAPVCTPAGGTPTSASSLRTVCCLP